MPTVLNSHPAIVLHEQFLSPDEVTELLRLSSGEEKTTVVDNESGESVYSNYRTGKLSFIPDDSEVALKVFKRLMEITNIRRCQIEGLQVLKYGIADQYLPHTDWFHPTTPAAKKMMSRGGQRVISVVFGLKEAEEGGAIDFPLLKLTHKLKAGDAILFWNTMADGNGDQRTEHAAMPVVKGEKISLVSWIRERDFSGAEEKPIPPSEDQLHGMLQQSKNYRQIECAKVVEKALQHYNCGIRQTSRPVVDVRTGLITLKPEFRVEAK